MALPQEHPDDPLFAGKKVVAGGMSTVSVTVYARFVEAFAERGYPKFALTINAAPGSDLARRVERHRAFGASLTLNEDEIAAFKIDGSHPLDLSTFAQPSEVRFTPEPIRQEEFSMLRLTAESDGSKPAFLVLTHLTRGRGQRGGTLEGKAFAGILQVAIDLDFPSGPAVGSASLHINSPGISGVPVHVAYNDYKFLAACATPDVMITIETIGGKVLAIGRMNVPQDGIGDLEATVDLLDALVEIDQYSPELLSVPQLNPGAMASIHDAAQLLRGERLVQSVQAEINLTSDAPADAFNPPPGVALIVEVDASIVVGEASVPLGRQRFTFVDPRVEAIEATADEGDPSDRWVRVTAPTVLTELVAIAAKNRIRSA